MLVAPAHAAAALEQSWPPFVLVSGLLLVGVVAAADGLFEAAAARIERLPLGPCGLLLGCCALVALVTALLNLDTAVVFLTPVLIAVARHRGLRDEPFLYASVFMANASSLYLPGSNLTNLLVLSGSRLSGARFAVTLAPAALTASVSTALVLVVMHRRSLAAPARVVPCRQAPPPPPRVRIGVGMLATIVSGALIVVLRNAAPEVFAIGAVSVGRLVLARRLTPREAFAAAQPLVTVALLAFAVSLGTLARVLGGAASLLRHAAVVPTALAGVLAAILVNNLPAAVLLSARPPAHVRALLIGLDLGPNLAMTGSLSAFLWFVAARAAGAAPSVPGYSRKGLLVVAVSLPLTLLAAGLSA